ncbi:hypothetical protein DFP72DRAFT_1058212 [Ephemerocybe angulata]|uniref:Uncharacterized protein n=1 Tax=Ephemerocybe angulata TaxID=980116 RepID=A0A8H6IHA0_9AGAR|nr:hypothetical protein DFP72DRAFT_1058212 [Tulosesus angulatus]
MPSTDAGKVVATVSSYTSISSSLQPSCTPAATPTPPRNLGFLSYFPTNLGFLAFNWYQQYLWFVSTKNKELNALSLVVGYINIMYTITYLAGLSAENDVFFCLQALGTVGLIVLNTVTLQARVNTSREFVVLLI